MDLALAEKDAITAGDQLGPGRATPATSLPVSASLEAFNGNGCHIRLVEDNAVNRTLAQRLLQKRDFTVTIAVDGKQVIAATQSAEFDIVRMDIQMPEMDGLEATAEIRKREELTGWRTPIIALTAHAMKEDRERCLSAGMDAYVTKPIRPAELFSVIQSVLQSSAAQNGSTLLTPVPSPTSVFVRPLPFAEFRENKKISQRRACEWRLVRPECLTSRFELLGMGTASRPCEFCH